MNYFNIIEFIIIIIYLYGLIFLTININLVQVVFTKYENMSLNKGLIK